MLIYIGHFGFRITSPLLVTTAAAMYYFPQTSQNIYSRYLYNAVENTKNALGDEKFSAQIAEWIDSAKKLVK